VTQDEPKLYALAVTPPSVRPGELARLLVRARNLGATVAGGSLRFVLSSGLAPEGPLEVPLAPVAPGEEWRASLDVRAVGTLPGAEEAHAIVQLGERAVRTNEVQITLRGRPIVDGPASRVTVEALDADTVRVTAVVTNEGDAAAHDLRIVVPPPNGMQTIEGATDCVLAALEPGASTTLAYDARIVAPRPAVRLEDAFVALGEGARYALRADDVVTIQPVLALPRASIRVVRRRVDVAIDLPNEGWADAEHLVLELTLPAGVREVPGSVRLDDAATLRRTRGAPIVIPRIAARTCAHVALAFSVPAGAGADAIVARVAEHAITLPYEPEPSHDVRAHLSGAPAAVTPGEPLDLVVEVYNAGDLPTRPAFDVPAPWVLLDHDLSTKPLACGATARVRLRVRLDEPREDGDHVTLALTCGEGAAAAHVTTTLLVRDRAWLALDDLPETVNDVVRYVVRHVGTTPARSLVARFGEDVMPLDDLLPGARATLTVPTALARGGGRMRVGARDALLLPSPAGRPPARVAVRLDAPPAIVAGAPFAWSCSAYAEDDVDALCMRVLEPPGLAYVPGSTVLDGVPLLDCAGRSPLAGSGLLVRGLGAGTALTVCCAFVAARNEPQTLAVALDVDGDERAAVTQAIGADAPDALAARPSNLPYHVEAYALLPVAEPPAPVIADVPGIARITVHTLSCRFDQERRALLARALRGTGAAGLAGALLPLRALFPDAEASGDAGIRSSLLDAQAALADVFDRLYVKLRIPGFEAAAEDLEDASLRAALATLCARLSTLAPAASTGEDAEVALSAEDLRAACDVLAHAPHGAPAIVRFLLALVPDRCEDALLGAALARWTRAARAALEDAAADGRRAYDDALAHAPVDDALDDARAGLLAALRANVVLAGALA
jgi:hypothetical protein